MRVPAGACCLAVLLTSLEAGAAPPPAQSPDPPESHVAIDGPPPPLPPTVMARDSRGRVTIRAVRVGRPPRVDGALDDPVYQTITPISDFIQQEPDEGAPATEPTRVWVLFDRENLYISARCQDSQPNRIVANDMRRDGRNIGQNDNISVVLDTFYDRRNGYEFLINSIGGMQDAQITDERDVNRDWNTVWTLRSRRDSEGWTAEIAIPFRSLRYRGGGAQVWGINIRRTVRWKNEFQYLSPVPRTYGVRGILRFSSAATLVGIEPPSRSLNLEVKPYAVSSVRADRAVDPTFGSDLGGDAGVDAKYGLTRSLTADLTYRTDFAQVEDDDQQVNLTRFSVFFPEKREFFLEGQGIFAFGGVESAPRPGNIFAAASNTPVLFFSRQIGLSGGRPVPIEGGGRVTGKAGRYSIGLLDIQTDDNPAVAARATNFAVVRLKRDIFRRSYVGVIGTRRSPAVSADGANLALAMDANLYAGDRTELGYRGRVEMSARLSIEPGVTLNWVQLPEGRFTGKLLSARTTMTFSPSMFVAALVQYNSANRLLSTNARLRWEYRPGSEVFFVYNDGRDSVPPLPVLMNRSFTVKLTRLFRF